jgi:fucose permease
MVAFCIQASAPPFPLFVMANVINGFGASLEDAQANGFVANYKDNPSVKMGILHAAYGKCTYPTCQWNTYPMECLGAGALTAPLVATQFAQLHRWSFHYLTSLAVATLNTVLLVCIFRFKNQDGKSNAFSKTKSNLTMDCAVQNVWPRSVKALKRKRRLRVASTRKCSN